MQVKNILHTATIVHIKVFMHRIVHLATFEQIAYMQSKNGLKVR
nr:MAG TPA: hypothetical protein [Caudoviricetes sp.]